MCHFSQKSVALLGLNYCHYTKLVVVSSILTLKLTSGKKKENLQLNIMVMSKRHYLISYVRRNVR